MSVSRNKSTSRKTLRTGGLDTVVVGVVYLRGYQRRREALFTTPCLRDPPQPSPLHTVPGGCDPPMFSLSGPEAGPPPPIQHHSCLLGPIATDNARPPQWGLKHYKPQSLVFHFATRTSQSLHAAWEIGASVIDPYGTTLKLMLGPAGPATSLQPPRETHKDKWT